MTNEIIKPRQFLRETISTKRIAWNKGVVNKDSLTHRRYKIRCRSCFMWRDIGYMGKWDIETGVNSGLCKICSRKKHGMSNSRLYFVWVQMKERCFKMGNPGYKNYGARGITVCDRWLKFENFLSDMGERPEGKSLDRIDNSGNYEPSNCRWATREEQMKNMRRNVVVSYQGEELILMDWSKRFGINYMTLRGRFRKGERGSVLFRPADMRFSNRKKKI